MDYVVNCTGSSESADPNTTGGGVTSKGECLDFVCHKCHSTSCVPVGLRTRRVVSAQSGVKGVCLQCIDLCVSTVHVPVVHVHCTSIFLTMLTIAQARVRVPIPTQLVEV